MPSETNKPVTAKNSTMLARTGKTHDCDDGVAPAPPPPVVATALATLLLLLLLLLLPMPFPLFCGEEEEEEELLPTPAFVAGVPDTPAFVAGAPALVAGVPDAVTPDEDDVDEHRATETGRTNGLVLQMPRRQTPTELGEGSARAHHRHPTPDEDDRPHSLHDWMLSHPPGG